MFIHTAYFKSFKTWGVEKKNAFPNDFFSVTRGDAGFPFFFLFVSFCLPNWDLYNSVVYFVIFSFFIPTPASFLKRISPELRLCFKSMSLYFCLYFYRRKMSAAVSSQPSGCRNEKKIVFFLLATSPSLRRHLVAPSSEKLRILKRFPFLL